MADGGFDEIHIVEPRPFASRLHVLAPIVRGAVDTGAAVFIHLAMREPGIDLDDFLESLPSSVAVVIATEVGQVDRLTYSPRRQVVPMIAKVFRASRRQRGRRILTVLTAIDDYPRALLGLALRSRRSHSHVLMIRYRVPDLISRGNLKLRLRGLYFDIISRITSAHVVTFDERIEPSSKLHVVADPWDGPFGQVSRLEARRALELPASTPILLLVGYQDARKGFPFSARLIETLSSRNTSVRTRLVGRVDTSYLQQLETLRRRLGARFFQRSEYLSDDELALEMAAADVILIPYSSAFSSTSGVLVRAAASRTPVLATGGGLVGWRVCSYGLGKTFEPGNVDEALIAISDLMAGYGFEEVALEFVARSHEDAVVLQFRSIFDAMSAALR